MAHVIAITNQKGGVGKTTTAINLGAALAEMGHYTLLGDLDPQGGLSLGLGLAAHDLDLTIYNILTDTRIPIAGITHHLRGHLDLLPSNIDLAVAEFQLIAQMGREYILREALAGVRNTYEYVILDCPPSLNLLTVNALTAADSIIVPLQVEYFAMRGLEQLMDVVTRVRRRLNPDLEILGIVPTMVDVRRTNDQQIIQEVTKAYPGLLLDVYIKESIKFADAPRHQRSILELDPKHDGARAYRTLAKLVLKHYGEWTEATAPPEDLDVVEVTSVTMTAPEGEQTPPTVDVTAVEFTVPASELPPTPVTTEAMDVPMPPAPMSAEAVDVPMPPAPVPTEAVDVAMPPAPVPTETVDAAMPPAPVATEAVDVAMPPAPVATEAVDVPMPPAPVATEAVDAAMPPAPVSTETASQPDSAPMSGASAYPPPTQTHAAPTDADAAPHPHNAAESSANGKESQPAPLPPRDEPNVFVPMPNRSSEL